MKTYANYKTPSGKIHVADTWSDRAACGALLFFASRTTAPFTCKTCRRIQGEKP